MKKTTIIILVLLMTLPCFAIDKKGLNVGLGIVSSVDYVAEVKNYELSACLRTDAAACLLNFPFTFGASADAMYKVIDNPKDTLGLGLGISCDFISDFYNAFYSADFVMSYRHILNDKGGPFIKTGLSLYGRTLNGKTILFKDPLGTFQDALLRHTRIGWHFTF